MAGDGDDETILIYCTTDLKTSRCCNSGIELVPQMVSHVNFNDNWIIAKTELGQNNGYWIIEKITNINEVKSNVTGPLDSRTFNSSLKTNNVELELKKFHWRQ